MRHLQDGEGGDEDGDGWHLLELELLYFYLLLVVYAGLQTGRRQDNFSNRNR